MRKTIYMLSLCLLAVSAMTIAGCGGGEDSTTVSASDDRGAAEEPASKNADQETEKPPFRASVWRADSEDIKGGLFEFDGFTLYRFAKDGPSQPRCYYPCTKRWRPLLTEREPKGIDVIRSKLGTTKRHGGGVQVTYFGHPLYTYIGDKTTGEVSGHGVEDFGDKWYALRANGKDLRH
jgi:predicted lipoprotein with Yx(FWY)xxD motif